MASNSSKLNQSLDLDFEFLDHNQDFFLELASDKGSNRVNVDDLLEPERESPLFGNDLSLASALNLGSDDDFLACAPTDVHPLEGFNTVKIIETKQSPWHESDSGMSEATTTPSSSPQRSSHDDNMAVGVGQNMVELNVNVEDLDFEFDQCSPSSSTASPPHTTQDATMSTSNVNVSLVDELITMTDVRQQQALEFYDSTDLFSGSRKSRTVQLVRVEQEKQETPEEKSKKNAIQAKINREKKKAYIKSLEEEITTLKVDNAKLNSENKKMHSTMSDLEEEVEYLKSVLVNSSSLSGLLKNISNVTEVKLSATVLGRKRPVTDDHSYNFVASVPEKRARRINENLKKAGVCLHVNGGSACLEFCAHCSKLAQKTSLS